MRRKFTTNFKELTIGQIGINTRITNQIFLTRRTRLCKPARSAVYLLRYLCDKLVELMLVLSSYILFCILHLILYYR